LRSTRRRIWRRERVLLDGSHAAGYREGLECGGIGGSTGDRGGRLSVIMNLIVIETERRRWLTRLARVGLCDL
jgi:hypothetical protein